MKINLNNISSSFYKASIYTLTFGSIMKGILEKTSGQIFFCGKNASRKILNENVKSGKIIVKDIDVNGTENLLNLLKFSFYSISYFIIYLFLTI